METVTVNFNCPRANGNEGLQNGNLYKVEDRPPFVFSFFNALQILNLVKSLTVLCQVISVLWLPLLLTSSLCILPADPIRVYLVSTAFLTSGVVTSIQSTLGLRLPTVAVPSVLYAGSFLSLLQIPRLQCPSTGELYAMGSELRTMEWQTRLREVQGALMFAGVSQALLGFSGMQACLTRVLSPVALVPAVILAGLSVVHQPLLPKMDNWTLFTMVAVIMVLFALQLRNVCIPLPTLSIHNGLTAKCFSVFRMFPVLWTCVAVYVIYKAVSIFNSTTPGPEKELVDFQEAIDNAKWFSFPFPFEYGWPTLSLSTAVHLLPAVILQSVTSLVLFYACANTCDVGPPSQAAVSRGLGVEGLGLVFGSFWGHGVSTNTANIGLMSFTGIVSRSSTQLAALLMICLSHFTKVTATLANIPVQFLSALHLCLHAGLVCVGIAILKFTDFTSPRDGSIVGLSLCLGLVVPQTASAVATGMPVLDSFLSQTLGSSVLVGAIAGCLLDLLLPGRVRKNKSHPWRFQTQEDNKIYRLPTWEELLCSALERSPFFSSD